jgi:hypothetical protein
MPLEKTLMKEFPIPFVGRGPHAALHGPRRLRAPGLQKMGFLAS